MSKDKLRAAAQRWLAQATDDLESARLLQNGGKYATACFLAQQAAEKGIKAVDFACDGDPWGHSVTTLIGNLPAEVRDTFMPFRESAQRLDKLYIPTRYPDALPDMVPALSYSYAEATNALTDAEAILAAVTAWFANT